MGIVATVLRGVVAIFASVGVVSPDTLTQVARFFLSPGGSPSGR